MSSNTRVLSIDELHRLTRKPKTNSSDGSGLENIREANELWSRLNDTVRSPSVSDKHMTAACNAICFMARANAQNHNEALKEQAYSKDTWRQTFSAARSAFASGKNKPALQILDTLQYLAESNPSRISVVESVEETALEMARIIMSHQPRRSMKEACIVLYFFLRKLSDFMSFSGVLERALDHEKLIFLQLCHASGMPPITLTGESQPQWYAFVLALLLAVRITESKSATLKLLALLCGISPSTYQIDLPSVLSKSIDVYSAADETALEAVTRDVLPSILTTKDLYMTFLSKQKHLVKSGTSAILVILTLLQYGKSKGFASELGLPDIIAEYCLEVGAHEATHSPYEIFACLLSHGSASVRLRACEVLLSSTSPNTALPSGALPCLIANLGYLHDDIDAFHRGELFSIFRRFLTRVQQSRRALEIDKAENAHSKILSEYRDFYRQYLLFIKGELFAGKSYPRHILALQMLHLASSTPTSHRGLFQEMIFSDQETLRGLFCLLLDPYDDVRALASEILLRAASEETQQFKDTVTKLDPSTTFSNLAAATNRADHADALGRVLSLVPAETSAENYGNSQISSTDDLNRLSDQLSSHLLCLSAFDVTDKFPLHGVILGVRYMIENLTRDRTIVPTLLAQTLLELCQKIWTLSQSHLCVDSPEMESESSESTDSGPKDRLAYAWRALRDSNLMMQAMLEHLGADLPILKQIGDMCFSQLALLRHRGAFSTVAQTFVLCCQKARESIDTIARDLVDRWFSEAISELEKQADKLTRRSAGLPAMFTAIFDPANKDKFSACFEALVEIAEEKILVGAPNNAEDKLRLPQVHALNCIKEIMTSSRFRVMTEPSVVFTLNLAARCMSAKIWAIKNCGLMLLRASINRLDPDTGLEHSEAGMKLRTTSDTERRPVDVATDFLGKSNIAGSSDVSTEAVFAGLDILGRLYVDVLEQDEIRTLVAKALGLSLWHIRAQAARLSAIMTPRGTELTALQDILVSDRHTAQTSLNEMHGTLMLVECLTQRLWTTTARSAYEAELISLLLQTLTLKPILLHAIPKAKWLCVVNQLFENTDAEKEGLRALYDAFEHIAPDSTTLSNQPDALYNRHLATFRLRCYTLLDVSYTQTTAVLLQQEDDVLMSILETFRPRFDSHSAIRYLDVLIHIAENRTTQSCSAVVMQAIATNLAFADGLVDSSRLDRLLQLVDFITPPSRDLLNSQIVFFATLCRWTWAQKEMAVLDQLTKLAGSFCLHLRTAADDEVEFDTRSSATKAFQKWRGISDLDKMLNHLFEPVYRIEILAVLYDLLNDDDEDIRGEASEFTAELPAETTKGSITSPKSLCAAASRQNLRNHIQREFACTDILRDECLRRILGKKSSVSRIQLGREIENYLGPSSVRSHVVQILNAMSELFVEEKQNLYVDEATEVKNWTAALARTSFRDDSKMTGKLAAWAKDGAEYLNIIFRGNHPLSSTLFDVVKEDSTRKQEEGSLSLQTKAMFGTTLTEDLELLVTRIVVGLRLSGEIECAELVKLHEYLSLLLNRLHHQVRGQDSLWSYPGYVIPRLSFVWSYRLKHINMNSSLTIFVCFIVVMPLCVWLGWNFWQRFFLQAELDRYEEWLRRQEACADPAEPVPPAAPTPPPAVPPPAPVPVPAPVPAPAA